MTLYYVFFNLLNWRLCYRIMQCLSFPIVILFFSEFVNIQSWLHSIVLLWDSALHLFFKFSIAGSIRWAPAPWYVYPRSNLYLSSSNGVLYIFLIPGGWLECQPLAIEKGFYIGCCILTLGTSYVLRELCISCIYSEFMCRGNIQQRDLLFDIIRSKYSMMDTVLSREPNACISTLGGWEILSSYFVESTGAIVTTDSSVKLIRKYCESLPGDKYV